MVIDSSAIIAILLGESEALEFSKAIESFETRLISSVSYLESSQVILSKKGPTGLSSLQALIFRAQIVEVGFSPEQSLIAIDSYRRFGKGRHPASLNLGDCCTYALAKSRGLPILFKGEDFSKTDARSALGWKEG